MMKTGQMIIFISIVTLIYGGINAYIYIRGTNAFPSGSSGRIWFTVIFWALACTFVLARFLERAYPSTFTGIITWIGSFWLGFMLFFVLFLVVIDLVRLTDGIWHYLPSFLSENPLKTRRWLFWSVLGLSTILVTISYLNARIPAIRHLEITINKPAAKPGSVKIVMASDIHLGTIIASRKAERLVKTINRLKPDIVLFAGDIVDEDIAPVINQNLGASLQQIKAPLGVYGITGNHEFIGGVGPAVKYLQDHGITMLRDTAVLIDNRFWLVGREDRDGGRFAGKERKKTEILLQEIDTSLPIVLMDHQPFNLAHHATLGIDLQVSGHTHHGQLWPLNYITNAIFEVSRGYKQIGNTHFYVSTGYGTWGPPLRLGNRPEIVEIVVHFTKSR
jgi:uncharacterized protein